MRRLSAVLAGLLLTATSLVLVVGVAATAPAAAAGGVTTSSSCTVPGLSGDLADPTAMVLALPDFSIGIDTCTPVPLTCTLGTLSGGYCLVTEAVTAKDSTLSVLKVYGGAEYLQNGGGDLSDCTGTGSCSYSETFAVPPSTINTLCSGWTEFAVGLSESLTTDVTCTVSVVNA